MAAPRNFVVREVTTEQNGVTQIGQGNIINYADPLEKQRSIQRWFASWLFEDPSSARRSQANIVRDKGEAVKGCGEWLTHDLLPKWLASGTDGLWIHGQVGSGKSILCSLTTARLRSAQPGFGTLLVIPAIFSFDADYTNLSEFLPNTILARLCSLDPIPPSIKVAHETHLNSSEIVDVFDLIKRTLQGLEAHGAKTGGETLTIVIVMDAIDEVSYDQQRRTLDLINNMIGLNDEFSTIQIRAISFTRSDTRVQELCPSEEGWTHLPIPENSLRDDILTAVLGRLRDSRLRMSDTERLSLAETIAQRASGMFRLAGLYVDHLLSPNQRKLSAKHLETIISGLPDDLYAFYDRIIEKIDFGTRSQAFKALRWLLHSAKVISLDEITEACSIEFPGDDGYVGHSILEVDPLDVIDPLSGFISIYPSLPENTDELELDCYFVTIAHFSVGEYLKMQSHQTFDLAPSFYSQLDANLYLIRACFCYLAQYLLDKTGLKSREWPLIGYVCVYWSYHVAAYLNHCDATYSSSLINLFALKIQNCFSYADARLYDDASTLRDIVENLINKIMNGEKRAILDRPPHNIYYPFLGSMIKHVKSMYTPLDLGQMRLFILYPSTNRNDPVQGDIFVCSLENKPNYEFMSYYWAKPPQWTTVLIGSKQIKITRSLSAALLDVRNQLTSPQAFWVDQLCMNQDNEEEVTNQVQQLSGSARSVRCWINPQDAIVHENPAFEILSNKLWTRAMIVRELALARSITIMCGERSLSWEAEVLELSGNAELSLAEDVVPTSLSAAVKTGVSTVTSIRVYRERRANDQAVAIEELLYGFRHLQTVRPIDKVMAMLPMVTGDTYNFEDDGEIPFTFAFVQVAVKNMEKHNALDLLSINNIDECRHGLPSWVPCWVDQICEDPLSPGPFKPDEPSLFQASKKQPRFEFREAISELHIYGVAVDVVSLTWTRDAFMRQASHTKSGSVVFSNPPLSEDYQIYQWPDNIIPIKRSSELGKLVRCDDPAIARALTEERIISRHSKTSSRARDFNEINLNLEALPVSRADRLICKTKSGRLGNVPKRAKPGDVIVVFEGAKTPHLLRTFGKFFPGEPAEYILIGECYVDGLVDGQAEELVQDGQPIQPVKFMII